ncbi:MAG: DUF2231 domain-containing protein [Thermomicrobiales bacterium]
MADTRAPTGAESKAAIAGHPIHPVLIPFPIALLVGALATDLGYWGTEDAFWARASVWLTGVGLLMGALAAAVGLIDFWGIDRVREHTAGWIHALGNTTVLVVALVSWWLRLDDAAAGVLPWGLTLSAINAALLGVTGWYGGELSYRHRIGVTGHGG